MLLPKTYALIRQSNTTPCLTLRFEKKTKEDLELVQNEYISLVNNIINNL